jgi:arginine/ornithine transport system permease protein
VDFAIIIDNLPLYIEGLWVTIQLVSLGLLFGLALALPLALLATSSRRFIAFWPRAYIYIFRGTPLLVQMFMLYYGAGQFEWLKESVLWVLFKEAYWCAIIAFSLNTAAYTGEILRGAIEQTPFGEVEAAKAYGMSRATQYRRRLLLLVPDLPDRVDLQDRRKALARLYAPQGEGEARRFCRLRQRLVLD